MRNDADSITTDWFSDSLKVLHLKLKRKLKKKKEKKRKRYNLLSVNVQFGQII